MRITKWIFGIISLLIVVFFAGGFLLPQEVTVARSPELDAPAAQIFPHVNSPKATEAWSPWLSLDPAPQVTYNDIPEGVGATMEWSSEDPAVGAGKMELIESIPDSKVVSALDFGEMGLANASYDLGEADGKTIVTWGLTADMGAGPVGRWMGLMMDRWVGADYEKGLANLKPLVEG